jgi:hypothetical protein
MMLESEKFAIAAHLHVVLRRVHGRVTDVEWMLKSPEYAREVIRVARGETHPDLLKLADKLEAVLTPPAPVARQTTASVDRPVFVPLSQESAADSASATDVRKRYVGTLR